jgi:phage protein D
MPGTLTELYRAGETFYVPHYQVKIEGRALPQNIVLDVLRVTYKDSLEDIDSFELSINNWDAEKFQFKYEPASDPKLKDMFRPGQKLELWMGYRDNVRQMLAGEITTLEPSYPESGGSTLSVRGLNVLHKLRTAQHTYSWEKPKDKTKDSEIAVWLGHQPRSDKKPGLGIEVRVNRTAAAAEEPQDYVLMNNQYDIVFLMERARRHGYEVVLKTDDKTHKEYVYFGPSDDKGDQPTFRLEWGKSLVMFKPTLTTANQIAEVVVRGWDRVHNKAIEVSAKWADLIKTKDPAEKARLERLAQAFGSRKEIITDRPVHSVKEAKKLAEDILRDQSKKMVTASASTVGLPDLRAGRKVQIIGFGLRLARDPKSGAEQLVGEASDFDGEYYITETTHTIGDDGYRVEIKARREDGVKK